MLRNVLIRSIRHFMTPFALPYKHNNINIISVIVSVFLAYEFVNRTNVFISKMSTLYDKIIEFT